MRASTTDDEAMSRIGLDASPLASLALSPESYVALANILQQDHPPSY